jgi:hypothetical protein
MNVEAILARLQAVRRSGRGWVAHCPAHEDRSPSLSVREGWDGRGFFIASAYAVQSPSARRVSSFTVRRLINAKQLRAVRVSKRVLVPAGEIDRVIAQGCGKHTGT